MIKTAQQVGQIIKDLRTKAKMTQDQLAKKLQITFQAVSKWEKGESYPDIQMIGMICEIFNVSIDDLLNNNIDLQQKKLYHVNEKIQNFKGTAEIIDVNAVGKYEIYLMLHNKTNEDIKLSHSHFLLLDADGNSIDPQTRNIQNYDSDTVGLALLHKIPNFIPSNTSVQIILRYSKVIENSKLWINIPDFIAGFSFQLFSKVFQSNLSTRDVQLLNRDEILDYYNFRFKKEYEFSNNQDYPKITSDMLSELIFPRTTEFYKKNKHLFEENILEDVAKGDDYAGWYFIVANITDPIQFREIVKKNFLNIDNELSTGHGGILKYDSVQEFMDQEIIEFIIKMRAKYTREYKGWTLEYLNNNNIENVLPEIKQFSYVINAQLFQSKVSIDKINEIIRESNISKIHEHHVIKLKQYYKDLIEESTMDFLLSKLPVEDVETLTRFKPFMSYQAWAKKKEEFFESEQAKLDALKEKI